MPFFSFLLLYILKVRSEALMGFANYFRVLHCVHNKDILLQTPQPCTPKESVIIWSCLAQADLLYFCIIIMFVQIQYPQERRQWDKTQLATPFTMPCAPVRYPLAKRYNPTCLARSRRPAAGSVSGRQILACAKFLARRSSKQSDTAVPVWEMHKLVTCSIPAAEGFHQRLIASSLLWRFHKK